MAPLIFDPGKMMFVMYGFVLFVALSEASYTCTYLKWTGYWPFDRQKMLTKQCTYGCCGEGVDQHCCDQPTDDDGYRKHWIIAASVAGGIAVVCVVLIIVICILKAVNVKKSRIYDDHSGTRQTRLNMTSPPPPPYHPVNIFIIDAERERRHRVAAPNIETRQEIPQFPTARDQPPPVFSGEMSSPPPYSFVDSNTPSEWKRWQS